MKKWIIILIAILVTAGIVVGITLNRGGNGNNNEVDTTTIGTIKVPGNDSTTKVIFSHPPELEGSWEKPTINALTIGLSGQITNISNRNVSFDVSFLFDGQSTDYIPPQTLTPGRTVKIARNQMIANAWGKSVLEVKIAIVPLTMIPPPTTIPPATIPETRIFTSAPKAPETPQEITAAFIFYAYGGEYQKAISLLETEKPGLLSYKETETALRTQLSNDQRKIESIKIDEGSTHIYATEANVCFIFKFKDGSTLDASLRIIKEVNKWRVALPSLH